MKRLIILSLGALLLSAPAFAQAKATADKAKATADKAATATKAMTAAGKVTAVSDASLTVKGKDAEWTFSVDKATSVTAKGASHKMAALGADKKPAVITEFVHVGDDVSVKYHDMGATKHAALVTVHNATPPPAKKK